MWEKLSEHLPFYMLALFAVMSGQVGRLGHKAEKGQRLTRARIFIELSMMPALGSIVGSVAQANGLPVWQILMLGVTAGWAGFTALQIIHGLVVDFVGYLASRYSGKKPEDI